MTYEYIIRTCFYFSRICPLLPDIQCLKIIILCILSSFLVVSSRKAYLILVTFFWQFWNCFFHTFYKALSQHFTIIIPSWPTCLCFPLDRKLKIREILFFFVSKYLLITTWHTVNIQLMNGTEHWNLDHLSHSYHCYLVQVLFPIWSNAKNFLSLISFLFTIL